MKRKVWLLKNNYGQWVLIYDEKYLKSLYPVLQFTSDKQDYDQNIFFGMIEESLLAQLCQDKNANSAWVIPTIMGMIFSQVIKGFPSGQRNLAHHICSLLNPDPEGKIG
jgi:hypothetical protein